MNIIRRIVEICITRQLISLEDAPWLSYALKKRIVSLLLFLPICAIGSHLSSVGITILFVISFCALRKYTSGIHARSAWKCFWGSIISAIVYLGIIPRLWNNWVKHILLVSAIIVIIFLAPFNHPNMRLSNAELDACKNKARKVLAVLSVATFIASFMQCETIVDGFTLGILMDATMLALAYFPRKEARERDKKRQSRSTENRSKELALEAV